MPIAACLLLLSALAQDRPGAPLPPPEPFALVPVREHEGAEPGSSLGHGLAFLGDLDHDGVVDYAVGAPRDPSRPESEGSVTVHSGKTGKRLFVHRGQGHGTGFGFAVAGGDCDGDGVPDVAISAPYGNKPDRPPAGNVQFFSGKDGRLLRELWGTNEGEGYGWSVTALGDVDRDGATDYAIGAPYADRRRISKGADLDVGRVDVVSGKKGRLLYSVWGAAAEDRFGWCGAVVEDCNADGIPELLVGAEGATRANERPGSATLLSGKTGDVLNRLLGESDTYFGAALCSLGDLDGDHFPDLAVGAWNAGAAQARTGEVRILSGRQGKVLHVLHGRDHLDQYGRALANAGDLDRDGVPDLAVGAPAERAGGYVQVLSGKTFTVLTELRGSVRGERYGATLRSADIDGDGLCELLVGAGVADLTSETAGRAVLLRRR